ncbi:MAG TPA: hypothetical protein VGV93_03435, partial [Acidimicrobiales bacterium]|nr:hypothetical protein [Acidimicrobiales bacterium]
MIVDDHPVIGDSMAMALRAHGFEPVVAVPPEDLSVRTVVETARSVEPAIVMLDLFLGGDQVSVPMIVPLVELGARVIVFTASNDPKL